MIGWIVAFLVHSTLWLGLAWLWTRLRPSTSARIRETVWYTAIAASLITPTVQTFASPGSTLWNLPLATRPGATAALEHAEGESHEAAERARGEHDRPLTAMAPTSAPREEAGLLESTASWAWAAIAGVFILWHCGRLEALRRRLGRREKVRDEGARHTLEQLSRRAGLSRSPRLTENDNLGSPIALGVGRRAEICVPTRALHELDGDEFRALLGHEVAHHARRDTLRLGTLNTLQAVLFFQPLLRVALHAVHAAAEEQCDDWAAEQVDDRLAMASCLTEVAAWVLPEDRRLPVPCMARRRSLLKVRVDRLMSDRPVPQVRGNAWRRLGAAGLLAVTPWLAPGVATSSESPPPERSHERDEGHDDEHARSRGEHSRGEGGEHRTRRDGEGRERGHGRERGQDEHRRRREGHHEHGRTGRGGLRRMLETIEALRRSVEARDEKPNPVNRSAGR